MRALAISVAIATVLLLLTGGRLILIPLLFVPLGLLNLRRGRELFARLRTRRLNARTSPPYPQ